MARDAADELLDVVFDEPDSSKVLTDNCALGPAFHSASNVSSRAVSTNTWCSPAAANVNKN